LNREGRLEGFNARREELRAALREQGMRRKEAADEAWRQALAEFPPLASDPGLKEALARCDASENEAELENDAMWVYTHLSARNLSPVDASSPGAWSMLLVTRKDKR
jgi:hypothetical protein